MKAISVYLKHTADGACELLHECRASASNISGLAKCQLQKVTIRIQSADSVSPASPGMTTKVWVKSTHTATGRSEGNVAVLLRDDSAPGDNTLPKVIGKVYSIMALPLQNTSLPVHINGAFCMSADRRTLWAGDGDRGKVRILHSDQAYVAELQCTGNHKLPKKRQCACAASQLALHYYTVPHPELLLLSYELALHCQIPVIALIMSNTIHRYWM